MPSYCLLAKSVTLLMKYVKLDDHISKLHMLLVAIGIFASGLAFYLFPTSRG